jgi:hypothetical protein
MRHAFTWPSYVSHAHTVRTRAIRVCDVAHVPSCLHRPPHHRLLKQRFRFLRCFATFAALSLPLTTVHPLHARLGCETMSALDVSAVVALANKATVLHEQGAYARAAELYARAAAAAQALGARDCLVVAALQIEQASCWVLQSRSPLVATPADAASMHDAAMALLPAAMATLLRRRAAGTLLPGTCAPHEEAWERARLTHELKLNAASDDECDPVLCTIDASMLAALAMRVGYKTYLCCAQMMVVRVYVRHAAAEMRADVAFVCDALNMMTQLQRPLALVAVRFAAETNLLQTLQSLLEHRYVSAIDDAGVAQLLAARGRVERSGVLHARNIAQAAALMARNDERVAAVTAAALAAKGLRFCALDSCGAREVHVSHFKLCGTCKAVVYCSKEHQAAHWRQHKAACKAARNGGAAGATPSER